MSEYGKLGIDAGKKGVRKVFGNKVSNHFPGAFVNIIRDPFHPGEVATLHLDGDGSKIVQRLLMLAETNDPSVIAGAVNDALEMNLGDIAAAGFVRGLILVGDVINVNRFNVPKELLMAEISKRFGELISLYERYGFTMFFMGGETADLPDQVQSAVFDVAVSATAKEEDIIIGDVRPGDFIWGFASDGQAVWEKKPNSGLMANFLSLSRVATMWSGYTQKYPHLIRQGSSYNGRFMVGDIDPTTGVAVGQELISPTRHWAILIKILLDKLKEKGETHFLHGISMNTGGGATKIAHVGQGIRYTKNMPIPPDIFQIVHRESGEKWKDMFQGANCGVGLDIVGDGKLTSTLWEVQRETGVHLYDLGLCKLWEGGGNKVTLYTPYGEFEY